MVEKTYAGKIKNSGAQSVKAPCASGANAKKGKAAVKVGDDLRNGGVGRTGKSGK